MGYGLAGKQLIRKIRENSQRERRTQVRQNEGGKKEGERFEYSELSALGTCMTQTNV